MPTLSDILAAIDALKRGIATNPLETAKDYGRGVVANAADMGDMALQAFSPTPQGMGPTLGEMARGLLGNTGTSVENTGGLLGIPGAGTAASAGMKLAAIGKGAIPAGGLLGQMVYHGTPHKFAKYDLSKIGTGEGAQAYGHGIYFAENPKVAKQYAEDLGANVPAFNGVPTKDTAESFAHDILSKYEPGVAKKVVDSYVDGGVFKGGDAEKMRRDIYAAIDRHSGAKVGTANVGNLFQQDLPDSVLPRMLQWDKPLKRQPENVQNALAKSPAKELMDSRYDFTGRDAYEFINEKLGANSAAGLLKSAGIPGLSYLDQGSRHLSQWEVGKSGAGTWLVKNQDQAPHLWQEFPTEAAAKAALKKMDPMAGGTMNHVIWDQDLLDRMIPQSVP